MKTVLIVIASMFGLSFGAVTAWVLLVLWLDRLEQGLDDLEPPVWLYPEDDAS